MTQRYKTTVHKKYRRYNTDIFGRVAMQGRDTKLTRRLYRLAQENIRHKLKFSPPATKKRILKSLAINKKDINSLFKKFSYQINVVHDEKRRKPLSHRGALLATRRKISLFYGGGRIRKSTFHFYGRNITYRGGIRKNELNQLYVHRASPFTSFVESRLDVLLTRANFCISIYQARQFILHRKVIVEGLSRRVFHPAFLLRTFQIFKLTKSYAKRFQTRLKFLLSCKRLLPIPSYLHVSFSLMYGFLISQPKNTSVGFPGANMSLSDFQGLATWFFFSLLFFCPGPDRMGASKLLNNHDF